MRRLIGTIALLLAGLLATTPSVQAQTPVDTSTGTATLASGTTEVVAHGLGETPEAVVVTPTNEEGAVFWITSIGATNFTINIPTSQSANPTFAWLAYAEDGEDVYTTTNGTATLSAGSTSVTATHELGATPGFVSLQPEDDGGEVFWVDSIGSTSFDINVPAQQGGDVTYRWLAVKKESEVTDTGLAHLTNSAAVTAAATSETVTHGSSSPPLSVFPSPQDEEGAVWRVSAINENDFQIDLPAAQSADADYSWSIFSTWPLFSAEAEQGIQPVAAEIDQITPRDTDSQQRSLPLMDIVGQVEDDTGWPLVQYVLTIVAGATIIGGAVLVSRLAPDNTFIPLLVILVASLMWFAVGVIPWWALIAVGLLSLGTIAFSQRTPA